MGPCGPVGPCGPLTVPNFHVVEVDVISVSDVDETDTRLDTNRASSEITVTAIRAINVLSRLDTGAVVIGLSFRLLSYREPHSLY